MILKMKKHQNYFNTVIEKNTFYFYNTVFQEKYESYLNSLNQTLLFLKNEINNKGLEKEIFESLLENKENGLRCLLALTGFANESLKRLITVVRITDNKELSDLLYKEKWVPEITEEKLKTKEIKEWGDKKIDNLLKSNIYFRKGIVNLFFEGSTTSFLCNLLPLFELKKLSISKLNFEIPAMIDTLVRYKEKGSYSGKSENNPEFFIASLLKEKNISFEKGDLTELFTNENISKRTMDFIIPNKKKPKIIIECSFLVTTSSGKVTSPKPKLILKILLVNTIPKQNLLVL